MVVRKREKDSNSQNVNFGYSEMYKASVSLPEVKLVGIATRTSNAAELTPAKAKIGSMVQQYFQQQIAERITNRKKPMVTYIAYANYESDFRGDYDCFIGEEVSSFDGMPD